MGFSILNPFKTLEEEPPQTVSDEDDRHPRSPSGGAGVKEDLSELGKTIGRQLWGVASFLAPPPPPSASADKPAPAPAIDGSDSSASQGLVGIRNDFAEIGGSFKSRLSMISTNLAVNEISRLASNLLQFDEADDGDDDGDGENFGVTEEVLEFAKEVSARPECWIDFPLPLDDFDSEMSDVQREHALTVGDLVPGLVDLKSKICPSHMNEGHFWIVYFILLLPRLNKHDLEMLSTPQVLEARELLLQKLQNSEKAQSKASKPVDLPLDASDKGDSPQLMSTAAKQQETSIENVSTNQEDEDVDQWLEEDVETGTSQNRLGNEQEVSFSDLEDDDDNDTSDQQGRSSSQQSAHASSSPSGSSGWVQLSENSKIIESKNKASRDKDSEGDSSNDWLTVDDFDSDSVGAP